MCEPPRYVGIRGLPHGLPVVVRQTTLRTAPGPNLRPLHPGIARPSPRRSVRKARHRRPDPAPREGIMYDRVVFIRITEEQRSRLRDFLVRARICLAEPRTVREKRIKEVVECPLCYHFHRPRARVHVPHRRKLKCFICGKVLPAPFPSDKIWVCEDCALKNEICTVCRADIRLNTKRRNFPTIHGKTERESAELFRESTVEAQRKLEDLLRRADMAQRDAGREKRLSVPECPVCFYLPHPGQCGLDRERKCLICGGRSGQARLCRSCAERFRLCLSCGAEIDLKIRRKKGLPF